CSSDLSCLSFLFRHFSVVFFHVMTCWHLFTNFHTIFIAVNLCYISRFDNFMVYSMYQISSSLPHFLAEIGGGFFYFPCLLLYYFSDLKSTRLNSSHVS